MVGFPIVYKIVPLPADVTYFFPNPSLARVV